MFAKGSFAVLSSSERRVVQSRWLRSGQCARCFHATRIQLEKEGEENTNESPSSSVNIPKRGKSRQQRAAQISNEISMLQKGPPPSGDLTGPGSATGTYQAPPKVPTASAGFLETPNDMSGTPMGENVSAGREGPNAQGAAKPLRYEDRGDAPQDTTIMARGSSASGTVQEPAEGGASIMDADTFETPKGHHMEWVERSGRTKNSNEGGKILSQVEEKGLRKQPGVATAKGVSYKPTQLSEKDLLHSGTGNSTTILSNNFEGVIKNQMRMHSIPSSQDVPMRRRTFKQLNTTAKRLMVDGIVAGKYDEECFLSGEKLDHSVLKSVAKQLSLNGSYLPEDTNRLLEKVQSLLPAAAPARKGQAKQVKK